VLWHLDHYRDEDPSNSNGMIERICECNPLVQFVVNKRRFQTRGELMLGSSILTT
jgi:hypothetical protein